MRISNHEAEQRAIDLAEAFLKQQDMRGWSWRCLRANIDLFAADNKHRKTFIKWVVLFDLCPPGATLDNGSVSDGPLIVFVNIANEDVRISCEPIGDC
jgi:hypothetical protein